MPDKPNQTAVIFQIREAGSVGFSTLTKESYSVLLRHIDGTIASRITRFKTEQFSTPIASLDVIALAKKMKIVLSIRKNQKQSIIILELLSNDADVHSYDDLCDALYLTITDTTVLNPLFVCIAVSNRKTFLESVILNRRLIPSCHSKNVGLVLFHYTKETIEPQVLFRGTLPVIGNLPALKVGSSEKERDDTAIRLRSDEIAELFQIIFGHFRFKYADKIFHIPAIASVRKLVKNYIFQAQLRLDLSRLLSSQSFMVFPFGIAAGGMRELSLALVDGDASRICSTAITTEHKGVPLAIFCDFISPMYPIPQIIQQARDCGIDRVVVAGVASFEDIPDLRGVPKMSYMTTPYKVWTESDNSCRFCLQGGEPIDGEHFEDYASKVGSFDRFTFWEFISQDRGFFKAGHWASDRTPNHYQFRIKTAPIFHRFSFDLSIRFKNMLRKNGIAPAWVRKIVCTEGRNQKPSLYRWQTYLA